MRVSLHVKGIVQGVGFRPFVYQTARALGLSGFVRNARSHVELEAQGPREAVEALVRALRERLPKPGRVDELGRSEIPEKEGERDFRILESEPNAKPAPLLPPDLAICDACREETLAGEGRRAGYAFTCCARCGPRYSILESLPYDRARTSMRDFVLCAGCRREYEDPSDRRFHAEPIACPRCGPTLFLLSPNGTRIAEGDEALLDAAKGLREGNILALRGLGGFQLLTDATSEEAVERLRARKERDEKPFALLFADLSDLEEDAALTDAERAMLQSPEAPIVLVRRKASARLAHAVAPKNPLIGAMLPSTPLLLLLMREIGRPLICTSGNVSGEPLCTDTEDALLRLGAIADVFLTHNRAMMRPIDDSVVREGLGARITVLRRARGFAPIPVGKIAETRPILALGAFLKSTITLSVGGALCTSQHLGDMDDPRSVDLLERSARELCGFYEARPSVIACDLHPDFPSTRLAEKLAREWGATLVRVQHHHAHVASAMVEHGLSGDVLGLVWDGYGFGTDGAAWGGEALCVSDGAMKRFSHLLPFRLPGGDRAAREPLRSALGLLLATFEPSEASSLADERMEKTKARALLSAAQAGFSAPETTSMGRLFDGISALLGICTQTSFEGQAAMALQFCAEEDECDGGDAYPLPLTHEAPAVADLRPLLRALVDEKRAGQSAASIARRFHHSLADLAVRTAERAGLGRVVLAGGCFQNTLLARATRERLEKAGFEVFLPERVPVNDAGISVGQILVASQSKVGHGEN